MIVTTKRKTIPIRGHGEAPQKNRLERREVAMIKAMMATPPRKTDQDILAYFTGP